MRVRLLVLVAILAAACVDDRAATDPLRAALPPPLSVTDLRMANYAADLDYVRPLAEGQSFTAYLVSYRHSGLTLYAMVAVPKAGTPKTAFPVVIANHGYVPDPRRYGITAEGIDSRPGDYYRAIPELFTSRGFVTVIPDYRGHNSSDGFEYIDPQNELSPAYYAEDVVALLSAILTLDIADTQNLFLWSHSMGGTVSMRALVATDLVKASSFWATMPVDELAPWFGQLDGPVVIHHSVDDASTDSENSRRLARMLGEIDHAATYYEYEGDEHFFNANVRELAADRDAAFFKSLTPSAGK